MLDIKEFHKSTSRELYEIKNRVRNLIGSANWNEEGRYKEAVLRNVIRRFLPKKYAIGTGFIVKSKNRNIKHEVSRQIDLIIYDTSFPILFSGGDIIISTPEPIRGIIEVKTNLENQNLKEIVKKQNQIGEFIIKGKKDKSKPFFNGVFSYQGYEKLTDFPESIKTSIRTPANTCINTNQKAKFYIVNHLALNKNLFIKYWRYDDNYSAYGLKDLSFSYFISNLIYFVTEEHIEDESNLWFPEDKESEKICDF